jgi:hypothetical protein
VDLGPCLESNAMGSERKLQEEIEEIVEWNGNGMVLKVTTINMKKKRKRGRREE